LSETPAHRAIRVLYVHHRRELGGAPTSLALLIGALDRARFEPHVFCPPGPAERLFRSAGAVVHTGPVAGFTHIWASTYHGARWLLLGRELLRLPGHVAAFERVLREGGFAIVHPNDSPPLAAAWLARRRGIPVVWHLRSAPPESAPGVRFRLLRKAIRRWSAATIAINGDVAGAWDVPAGIVPNPVDLERFSPGRAEPERRRHVVSSVGFLYPAKGFRELIGAAALLRERGVEATVVLAGGAVRDAAWLRRPGGTLARRLGLAHDYDEAARMLVGELDLGERVRFDGYVGEVADVYRGSDVVVAASQGPELGRSLLEAAACGVAAVGTGSRTGGGVLSPGETTVFAEGRSAAALADALEGLIADPGLRARIGVAARAHAVATFDPDRIARQVEAVYDRVLAA
jgi:glycosyltransferase involved in cell wall biosynthesis